MALELVPLLQLQRDLYDMPVGQARFQMYLETLLNADGSDAELLPMMAMNPMGKAHIPALLDALLALDAEEIAAQTLATATDSIRDPGCFKLGLVVADDLMGGWTNRYTSEFTARFELKPSLKRGWLSVTLWTSETPSAQTIREATLTMVYRAAYIQQHGAATTLGEMLNQEGTAMAMAGCQQPRLEAEDQAYSDEVIAPHRSTQDYPTIMACLFGDRAAHALGYPPFGLSDRAGLAVALHQAQQRAAN